MGQPLLYYPVTVFNSNVGNVVFSIKYGFGKIIEINDNIVPNLLYPIVCIFYNYTNTPIKNSYSNDGKSSISDYAPSIFHAPSEISKKSITELTIQIKFNLE